VGPLFFDDGKVVFNGIEVGGVGGQEEDLMSCLFRHRLDRLLFVERRVIENEGGMGAQGLEEMLAQPLVEPQGSVLPVNKNGARSSAPRLPAIRLVRGRVLPLRSPWTCRPLGAQPYSRWVVAGKPDSSR